VKFTTRDARPNRAFSSMWPRETMSKNAPWARRPSGHTVPSSPAASTNPKPPRAGTIELPAEVFLMLMSVIVSPFLPLATEEIRFAREPRSDDA
jgi:hypothetical protein